MENLANNKLIAEFMGGVFVETNATLESNGYALRKDGSENSVFFYEFDLPYDRSWDWLMPVIEKCFVGEAEQSEEISNTTIKNIYEGICNQDISFAYKSVVEFIKQQKKQ